MHGFEFSVSVGYGGLYCQRTIRDPAQQRGEQGRESQLSYLPRIQNHTGVVDLISARPV
jgi:hypothetical protein